MRAIPGAQATYHGRMPLCPMQWLHLREGGRVVGADRVPIGSTCSSHVTKSVQDVFQGRFTHESPDALLSNDLALLYRALHAPIYLSSRPLAQSGSCNSHVVMHFPALLLPCKGGVKAGFNKLKRNSS